MQVGIFPANVTLESTWAKYVYVLRQGLLIVVALGSKGGDQGIGLAGGDPTDIGLHDHGMQGLIDPTAWLWDRAVVRS